MLCCATGCEVDGPALSSPWAERSFNGDPYANLKMDNNQILKKNYRTFAIQLKVKKKFNS